MAKGRTTSTSQDSASASAAPVKTTDGRMILRVRKPQQMKNPAGNKPKTSQKKKKKKTSKIDALKPKKPPTAFFYFLEHFRKEFQEKNPDVKSMRDIGKACGERWKTMTYEEKVQYYDIATEKRAAFDRAMADYTKRKERGEYEEYKDDSDFDN